MPDFIYHISFVGSLLGLSLWFYFADHEKLSRLLGLAFAVSFLAYLGSVAFSYGEVEYKLFVLFRDLIIMSAVSWFLGFFRKNKFLYFSLYVVVNILLYYFMHDRLDQTFPQGGASSLDKNGELLIEIKEGHSIKEIEDILAADGIEFSRAFSPKDATATDLDDYFVLNLPDNIDIAAVKTAISASAATDWLEDNELVMIDDPTAVAVPMRTKRKYTVNDPGLKQLWGFDAMRVDELYNFLKKEKIKPRKKAKIAILDTGIDAKHEDIKAKYVSTQSRYDNDPKSHGTHCAGIAAAVSNNGIGIASFAPNGDFVEVTSIKVLNPAGMGTQKSIMDGIIEAADTGADVISLSLGGRSRDSKQRAYRKAVEYANKKGAIVIVAAGNSNANAKYYAPANVHGVVTVAAVDSVLNRASFSNYVSDLEMGIAAPGVNIFSTIPENKYAAFSGTSMATPYVAGLAGLMKSIYPKLTTQQFYSILKKTGIVTKNTGQTGLCIQPAAAVMEVMKK